MGRRSVVYEKKQMVDDDDVEGDNLLTLYHPPPPRCGVVSSWDHRCRQQTSNEDSNGREDADTKGEGG